MDLDYNKVDAEVLPESNTRVSAAEYNQLAGSCMEIINASGLTPDAGDNEQLLNALKAILGPYIVETYSSGTSWYRVWSDGWCEQGGHIPYNGSQYTASVVFLKAFADTNYTLVGGEITNQAVNTFHNHASVGYNKTASGFSSDIAESPKEWIAKGYISQN